jgi:two-component system LytT family sensor kinase
VETTSGASSATAVATTVTAVVIVTAVARSLLAGRRDLGTSADRATFETLHTASLLAPGLRAGLNQAGAERAVRHLRVLLGTTAVAL